MGFFLENLTGRESVLNTRKKTHLSPNLYIYTYPKSQSTYIFPNNNKTMHHITTLLLITILISLSSFTQTVYSRYNTSVIPITKDPQTSLPKVTWGLRLQQWSGEPYLLIDLDSPFTWKDCIIRHSDIPCGLEEGCRFPVNCNQPLCKEAKSYINPICPSLNITDKYGCDICSVTPYNYVSNTCKISQLTTDLINVYLTNGRNPSPGPNQPFGTRFILSCAPSSALKSFPKDVRGVASFSWSGLSFPRQLSSIDIAGKFALCLPASGSALGVAFLGDGPFYFTWEANLDLRSVLSYTPMIRKSSKSLGYFITVNRIIVGKTPVSLAVKSVSVKLSTRVPYTVFRSDIFNGVVASFVKATGVRRVSAVKPFGFCFEDGSFGSGRVPNIGFETEGGKVWTVSGENLMKRVGNGVSCLAFVDGGLKVNDAVVIGTFQMEDNFLYFDLVNQKLGFSSSLLARGTSCSSFNFTEIAS
ncbi:hypothetical protein QVD17_31810 [Tagetes erecta]|uniref:Peptidase A1 domain-containing protein n=1 Tax=Tagetes erecta TaxID=13708 RepID=A0AAD8K8G9_TARER|nr:hypothetical protein QVD17_31810 [Tagetes erecta]